MSPWQPPQRVVKFVGDYLRVNGLSRFTKRDIEGRIDPRVEPRRGAPRPSGVPADVNLGRPVAGTLAIGNVTRYARIVE